MGEPSRFFPTTRSVDTDAPGGTVSTTSVSFVPRATVAQDDSPARDAATVAASTKILIPSPFIFTLA
jgi:hypothetical protein